ncbi:atherin-like [Portunus trituberculatus]|uniref:atherin-like n=1 Tax=Portunus trituberculatus TaxID=210409 RepID=UPI001E1CD4E4|nr:atherin-like [Portunus trituberculatus]
MCRSRGAVRASLYICEYLRVGPKPAQQRLPWTSAPQPPPHRNGARRPTESATIECQPEPDLPVPRYGASGVLCAKLPPSIPYTPTLTPASLPTPPPTACRETTPLPTPNQPSNPPQPPTTPTQPPTLK